MSFFASSTINSIGPVINQGFSVNSIESWRGMEWGKVTKYEYR